MRKVKRKFVAAKELNLDKSPLSELIKNACEGLYYISETDAAILPFVGAGAESISKEEILRQTNNSPDVPVEERSFVEVFERLIKIQDWYGEEEIANASKFKALKNLLENNLNDLKVFKIGKIELDIYFVGLDAKKVLTGIKTKAVET